MNNYISNSLIQAAVYAHLDLPVVYINNPKAGCSSIKASLWGYYDKRHRQDSLVIDRRVHIKTGTPFIENILDSSDKTKEEILRKPVFSVVRNPFSRIAASYLHKIVGVDPHILAWFCERFLLKPEKISKKSLPFSEFLKIIAFDDPLLLNAHFRPQTINTLQPFIPFDFVGHIEEMQEVATYLRGHEICLQSANIVPEAAQVHNEKLVSFYNKEAIDLVAKIYRNDFQSFGYLPDGDIMSGPKSKPKYNGEGIVSFLKEGAHTQSCLSPEQLFFWRFTQRQDMDAKLKLINETSHRHKNRGILRGVIAFLLSIEEHDLADEIKEHLYFCTTGHLGFLSDKSIIDQERLLELTS